MFASRTHRRTIACAIVGALLAPAVGGVAAAGANDRTQAAALAQERYYSSYDGPETNDAGTSVEEAQERYYSSYDGPETNDAGTSAAEAQERYYSSYGEPEPLTVAQSPEPSDDTPWLPIALLSALALAVVAASATLARRLRTRVTT